ncbi:hypothetical protein V8J82_03680 [Gymnodinialimonas sp. 2305UL16-5]|uniref:hypothetical protein n=1 Tax=Gymnodinialimonas mytili TaxID=3126503 RepID=UPI00309FE45D
MSEAAMFALSNAFWVFVGIVAGAFIQFLLSKIQARSQFSAILDVMKTELALNIDEYENLKLRLAGLKTRIGAGQVTDSALYIPMEGFDYSATLAQIRFGNFHYILGKDYSQRSLEFMRYFSTGNGHIKSHILKDQHAKDRSLDFIDHFLREADDIVDNLRPLLNARRQFWKSGLVMQEKDI